MMKTNNHRRNKKGAMIIFTCFLIGIIALPMIGMFTFEVVRATTIREQLRTASQAAALAGRPNWQARTTPILFKRITKPFKRHSKPFVPMP